MSEEAAALPEGCPIDVTLKFLAKEWLAHIVFVLGESGELRFGDLRRALPGKISARLLTERLRTLEARDLVHRRDAGTRPLHVSYRLTEAGSAMHAALLNMEHSVSDPELARRLLSQG